MQIKKSEVDQKGGGRVFFWIYFRPTQAEISSLKVHLCMKRPDTPATVVLFTVKNIPPHPYRGRDIFCRSDIKMQH